MPFTAQELDNITASALDFYLNKGSVFPQTIQKKPLLDLMERKAKNFSGGKENISLAVKGIYGNGGTNDTLKGFTHDTAVNFYNPANTRRVNFPWKEMHIGITMTHTELKKDGLSVTETVTNNGTRSHSGREMHVLAGLLETKLEDFGEQYARSANTLMWGDGTSDALAMQGLRAFIVDDPTTGTCGGLSRASNSWWRNRQRVGASAVTSSSAGGGALINVLQYEMRQLTRFGGDPDVFLAGSDFIDALEKEMRANGYYSQTGFAKGGELSVGELTFKQKKVMYDPTLDDLGLGKRAYIFPSSDIFVMKMDGEWRRQHTPARPHDQFVMHRSVTNTGQMVAKRLNGSLVIAIN